MPRAGDKYTSNLTGHSMVVKSATKKEITVEVERKVLNKSDGVIKMDKRTRVVPQHLWGLCSSQYSKD